MIRITHLSKHFRVAQPGRGIAGKLKRLVAPQHRVIRAVDDVSFEIEKGEIVGYLGPNGAGKSTRIVLTTHNLSDVERICPRIMIVDQGQIILDASQGEILSRFGRQRTLIVKFQESVPEIEVREGEIVKRQENKLWIAFDRDRISAFDLIRALGKDQGIADVSIYEPDIESIVAQIYEHGVGEEAR